MSWFTSVIILKRVRRFRRRTFPRGTFGRRDFWSPRQMVATRQTVVAGLFVVVPHFA